MRVTETPSSLSKRVFDWRYILFENLLSNGIVLIVMITYGVILWRLVFPRRGSYDRLIADFMVLCAGTSLILALISIFTLTPFFGANGWLRRRVSSRLSLECPEVTGWERARTLFVGINRRADSIFKRFETDEDVGLLLIESDRLVYRGDAQCFEISFDEITSVTKRPFPFITFFWVFALKWIHVQYRDGDDLGSLHINSRDSVWLPGIVHQNNDLYAYLTANSGHAGSA